MQETEKTTSSIFEKIINLGPFFYQEVYVKQKKNAH